MLAVRKLVERLLREGKITKRQARDILARFAEIQQLIDMGLDPNDGMDHILKVPPPE